MHFSLRNKLSKAARRTPNNRCAAERKPETAAQIF